MEGSMNIKCCIRCDETKPIDNFREGRKTCKMCAHNVRKNRYDNNPDVYEKQREKQRERELIVRNKKKVEKDLSLKTLTEQVGEENRICRCCNEVKSIGEYRYGYSVCKKCENTKRAEHYIKNGLSEKQMEYRRSEEYRVKKQSYKKQRKATDPSYRFITNIRGRIYSSLKSKQKTTIEYLGCDAQHMSSWLSYNFTEKFTFETYGKDWHIDHVIPISNFDLQKESEQLLAFNWKNTSVLSAKENLSKQDQLVSLQIEQNLQKLLSYHKEKKIEMPQEFIELFAKHLVAGNP